MSDTPETDGEWNRIACYDHPQFEQGIADFARKMERERDAFEKELAYVREALLDAMPNVRGSTKKLAELLVKERDELRAIFPTGRMYPVVDDLAIGETGEWERITVMEVLK